MEEVESVSWSFVLCHSVMAASLTIGSSSFVHYSRICQFEVWPVMSKSELYPQKSFALRNVACGRCMIPERRAVFDQDRVVFPPADFVDVFHGW
jgi:hypothetical protein